MTFSWHQHHDNDDDNDDVISQINTTPLVDVMLVLLIVFLITIPVVTHTVPLQLPTQHHQAFIIKPDTITLAINTQGHIFWGEKRIHHLGELHTLLAQASQKNPQPAIHIRADKHSKYWAIEQVTRAAQTQNIHTVLFITQPGSNAGSR